MQTTLTKKPTFSGSNLLPIEHGRCWKIDGLASFLEIKLQFIFITTFKRRSKLKTQNYGFQLCGDSNNG